MYSGYLPVSAPTEAKVFYGFTESERGAHSDPLVLWLQGGPGCSPAGVAAFRLNGPFLLRFKGLPLSDLRLRRNPHSWTQLASLLYLDTPVWTGFTHAADNASARHWDDGNTTALNLAALLAFYDRFPAQRRRPLVLAGHSYSGHYVPLLAAAILALNEDLPQSQAPLRLQGVVLGNPWTDPAFDNAGAVEFWYGQGFISRTTYDGLRQHCDLAAVALWRTDGDSGAEGECARHRDAALREAAGYSLYGINAPLCALRPDGSPRERQPDWPAPPSPTFDACAAQRVDTYMNRDDVQRALHAVAPGQPPRPWQACAPRAFTYDVHSLLASMLPLHRQLLDAGLRVLVYSGDSDGVVPTRATRTWVEALGLPPTSQLRPWRVAATNETTGYVVRYGRLTLATLHGAGHHAPYFQPRRALQLLRCWRAGEELPA